MRNIRVSDELFHVQVEVQSAEEAIHLLADQLLQHGYVEQSFEHAILEREKVFPTGLPLESMGVAIPHTDPEHVIEATIAIATLAQPVPFKMMGNEAESVAAHIVFMLAIKEPSKQIILLEKLMQLFQDEKQMQQLLVASKEEARDILQTALQGV